MDRGMSPSDSDLNPSHLIKRLKAVTVNADMASLYQEAAPAPKYYGYKRTGYSLRTIIRRQPEREDNATALSLQNRDVTNRAKLKCLILLDSPSR